ncbi:MAG TPA: hypothetical protein VHY35_21675 [Stellaceae bacterium]|jgi:hypothetical protein|nr:hypothetical protein [Stellaceae bacterium]
MLGASFVFKRRNAFTTPRRRVAVNLHYGSKAWMRFIHRLRKLFSGSAAMSSRSSMTAAGNDRQIALDGGRG